MTFEEKTKKLHTCMDELTKQNIAVAFSGGVDSSLLLKMAIEHATKNQTRVYAYTAHTYLHMMNDLEVAKKVALELSAVHRILEIDELGQAGIEDNPLDRCYLCKKHIFSTMLKKAKEDGINALIEGTNADDLTVYRPGLKAMKELGIVSPLAEAGFSKGDVRMLAKEYDISTSDRPSTPCMATRFPYGTHLTKEKLNQVEKAEGYLRGLGFGNVRVRVHDDLARIEIDLSQRDLLWTHKAEITEYLKSIGYQYITLDLMGFRSGSMDEMHLNK